MWALATAWEKFLRRPHANLNECLHDLRAIELQLTDALEAVQTRIAGGERLRTERATENLKDALPSDEDMKYCQALRIAEARTKARRHARLDRRKPKKKK